MLKSAKYVLGALKPKVFWGENAPGLYTSRGKTIVTQLTQIAKDEGYSFSLYKTNTSLHGIPQRRERTFYFFWKDSHVPVFDYFDNQKKSLEEYLKEVPESTYHTKDDIKTKEKELFDDHYFRWLYELHGDDFRSHVVEKSHHSSILMYAQRYDQYKSIKAYFDKHGHQKSSDYMTKLQSFIEIGKGFWDGSKKIFVGEFNALIHRTMLSIHPTENRLYTTREFMHLMGLPHDFELADGCDLNHICQNVPVCTANDMTLQVMKFINNELEISTSDFLKQSNVTKKIEHQESSLLEF